MDYAELEIALHCRELGLYDIDLRLSARSAMSVSEAERRLRGALPVRFDDEALRKMSQDPKAYGELLASAIFADEAVYDFFREARVCSPC